MEMDRKQKQLEQQGMLAGVVPDEEARHSAM